MKKVPFITYMLISIIVCGQEYNRPPLMGWSSWNTFGLNISDSLICQQADAMVSTGLKDVGYQFINIDDGYFGYRDEEGKLHEHPTRFPNGMKRVVDYIHSLGLKAGIYTDAGRNTCGSGVDPNGIGTAIFMHEQQDAKLWFGEWGFDYIKIDYCSARDMGIDEMERYTYIVSVFRHLRYGDRRVNICRWAFPGVWAKRHAESWRISYDIEDNWNSIKYIIHKNMWLSAFCSSGHYNDMDMLEIGRSLSPAEERTHMSVWCIMSSPLVIGCDMRNIPEHSLNLLKDTNLIALNQDTLHLQAKVVWKEGDAFVLAKDIKEAHGSERAVALVNLTDTAHFFAVPYSTLEFKDTDTLMELVEAHDTKVVHIFGNRLEPTRYEAEWAYLNGYNDLGNNPNVIHSTEKAGASLGMIVTNIGGNIYNYIEWRDIWSDHGGQYLLIVNGKKNEGIVTLKPGYNIIRLGDSDVLYSDIDYIELHKVN